MAGLGTPALSSPPSGGLTDAQLRATPVPVSLTSTTITGSVAVTNTGLTELAAAINASSQMDVNIAASGATVPVSNTGLTELAAAINADSNIQTYANGNVISTNNATTTPLAGNATYTGTADDVTDYVAMSISLVVDQSGTLYIEFSQDNTNWDHSQTYVITVTSAGTAEGFSFQGMAEARYFRIKYTNGATLQGVFRLQVILKQYIVAGEVNQVGQPILSQADAMVTKGVIYGNTTAGGGTYVAVKVTPSGALSTASVINDGTDDISILAAGADNVANTENQLVTAAMLYGWDGATWDRITNGGGTEASALRVTLASDSTGVVSVDDNAGSLTVDAPVGTPVFVRLSDGAAAISTLPVSLASVPSHAVTNAGTFAVQVDAALPAGTNAIGKLAANSGVDIGDVDVASLTGSTIAHDSADSGNPHKIGFKAYSPDGTTPGTAVAEGDRTDAKADLDGRQYVSDEHPRFWSFHSDGSTALTDSTVQAAPGVGFQVVITNIIVSTGAATAMNFFLEEATTKIFGPIYLEAVAGRGFCTPAGFKKHVTANTAVTITTSAAIAQAIDIQGYIQAL